MLRALLFSGVRETLFGAVAERLMHTPRKRASERTWGFESLPLRTTSSGPLGRLIEGAFSCHGSSGGGMRTPRGSTRRADLPSESLLPIEERTDTEDPPKANR